MRHYITDFHQERKSNPVKWHHELSVVSCLVTVKLDYLIGNIHFILYFVSIMMVRSMELRDTRVQNIEKNIEDKRRQFDKWVSPKKVH